MPRAQQETVSRFQFSGQRFPLYHRVTVGQANDLIVWKVAKLVQKAAILVEPVSEKRHTLAVRRQLPSVLGPEQTDDATGESTERWE